MGKPSSPNPGTVANLQNQSNELADQYYSDFSKSNSANPYGSTSWSQTGTNPDGTPLYTQTSSLSPVEQGIFNSTTTNQQDATNKAGAVLANWTGNGGLNFNPQLPALQTSAGPAVQATLGNYVTNIGNGGEAVQTSLEGPNPEQLANQSANAAYQEQMGYLAPQQQEQQSDLDSQLAAQGITQGSDAWNRAQGDLNRNQTFQQQQAESSAFNQGLNEENTLYGQELSTGNFDNAAQQQQYNQAMGNAGLQDQAAQAATQLSEFNAGKDNAMAQFNAQLNNNAAAEQLSNDVTTQNEPLTEYSALMNGTQPGMPATQQYGALASAPTNVAGIVGQNYANQVGAYNGTMQGLGSLGSAAMMSNLGGGSSSGGLLGSLGSLFGGGSGTFSIGSPTGMGAPALDSDALQSIYGDAGYGGLSDLGGAAGDGLASLFESGAGEEAGSAFEEALPYLAELFA
jgi:hypothetical protein